MKQFLTDQVAVLVSGSLVLFGLVLTVPRVAIALSVGNQTLGDLGLFLVASFAVGYALEAVGLVLEQLFWGPFGGVPMSWPARGGRQVLTRAQLEAVTARVKERFGVDAHDLRTLGDEGWRAVYAQMYAHVSGKRDSRARALSAGYHMSRALTAAFLALSAVMLFQAPDYLRGWIFGTLLLGGFNLYRMYRLGQELAAEVLLGFLESTPRRWGEFGILDASAAERPARQHSAAGT